MKFLINVYIEICYSNNKDHIMNMTSVKVIFSTNNETFNHV